MERESYRNAGRRAWWSVHIEAWRRSGLTQALYCRKQGIEKRSFSNWAKAIGEWEAAKKLDRKRRRHNHEPLSRQKRNRAVQAFWAMHVEALQWSGMRLSQYADAHRLSRTQLSRWRNLLATGEVEIDWRSLLHPSARPPISTNISTSAKLEEDNRPLTDGKEHQPGYAPSGPRRRFSREQKLAILDEAANSGRPLTVVARDHGIANSMIFRWRSELGVVTDPVPRFATVKLGGRTTQGPVLIDGLVCAPAGMKRVELEDGRLVFAPARAKDETVRYKVAIQELEA